MSTQHAAHAGQSGALFASSQQLPAIVLPPSLLPMLAPSAAALLMHATRAAAAAAVAADAECVVSVIVLMVSRLEKDGNLTETASKLASSIGKQVRCQYLL